jgi:hypothetical protein
MMRKKKNASGHRLDPALRKGDTVGSLASDALGMAADVLESLESGNGPADAADKARVCRAVAKAMVDRPLGNSSRVLRPTDLDGRYFTLTERAWPNAEVAEFLLTDTAGLMEALPGADGALKNQLRIDAQRLRQVATLVRLAPNGRLGPRLTELMPLLRGLEKPRDGEQPFPPLLIDGVTGDPVFWSAAQDVYRIVAGREIDDLPAQAQAVWAGKLAMAWLRRRDEGRPLTEAEAALIAEAVRAPREPWTRAPFIPGDWREQDPEAAAAVLNLIGAHHRLGPTRTPFPLAGFCDRVRTLPLRCHGGVMLIEVQGRVEGGTVGIASFLLTDDQVLAIDGTSAWIHDLNDAVGPHLLDEGARLDYVRLFMNSVRSGGERFQPVESFESLANRATDDDALHALCVGHARSIEPSGFDAEGRWLFVLVVCHQRAFFAAALALTPDGMLEMVGEDMLAADVPVREERMEGLFAILEPEVAIP